MIFSIFTKVFILFLLTLILLKMYRNLLFAVLLLSACKHSQDCPGFVGEDASWIAAYHNGDTAKFINAAGSKISFVMSAPSIDPSYTEECGRGEPMGTYCKPCSVDANIYGSSDTMRGNTKHLSMGMHKGEEREPGSMYFEVFDITGILSFDYQTHLPQGATVLPTLVLGGTTYQDVYSAETDTTHHSNVFVSKIYYNKQYGVLGFYDRTSHSLFYRE
ncbi:MAG: hypothetical protein JWP12_3440 [Bacteroidetes bacterium]|nr:hypothetical protein [Bacteroidota bacterium]